MKRLMSVRTARNLLVPGWIVTFGFAALTAPPLGVAPSLSLFVVGVIVVPALAMTRRPVGRRRAAVRLPPVPAGRFRFPRWRAVLRG
jgi:hypothetical protein